jgi:hypothetical protein
MLNRKMPNQKKRRNMRKQEPPAVRLGSEHNSGRFPAHEPGSGHFAVEDCLEQIATNIRRFYDEQVRTDSADVGLSKSCIMKE